MKRLAWTSCFSFSLFLTFFSALVLPRLCLAQADTTSVASVETPVLSKYLEESMIISGTINQQLDEHDAAIEMFLLGLEKNENSVPLLLGLSESYLSLQDLASAEFYIQKALGLDKKNPILWAHLLSIKEASKDRDEISKLLASAENQNIQSRDIERFRDRPTESSSQEAEESESITEKVSLEELIENLEPGQEAQEQTIRNRLEEFELDSATKLFLEGRLAYQKGLYSEASPLFKQSTSENPKNVTAWAFLIKAASKAGDLAAAGAANMKADLLFPFQKEIQLANIQRLIASNEIEEATTQLQLISVTGKLESEKNRLMAEIQAH